MEQSQVFILLFLAGASSAKMSEKGSNIDLLQIVTRVQKAASVEHCFILASTNLNIRLRKDSQ